MEGLGELVLETVLDKIAARDVAAVACVSTRLRAAASDDALWCHFCARDFALDPTTSVAPDGQPCPSFKAAYRAWYKSFDMYPLPLMRRVKKLWESIKSWLVVNYPEAAETMKKGASEAEIEEAENTLRVKFPIATKLLYRFCDGQDSGLFEDMSDLGIMGGYKFYDFEVNVHLLPLAKAVAGTIQLIRERGFSISSKYVLVAACNYSEKHFLLNCTNSQLYVGTTNLFLDGEMLPCVPQDLLKPRHEMNDDMLQDGFLLWLEEHYRRLQNGVIRTRVTSLMSSDGESVLSKAISLFPETPPLCSIAVTNGVQVRASAVFVPEISVANGRDDKYLFAYSIRMSLLPEGCTLGGTYYGSCQLLSRHWLIKSNDDVVDSVHGEAVIGKYPLLFPNKEEFVYESCSHMPSTRGSMEGSFTFVPGRLRKPEGRQFEVTVLEFPLEVPEYIF